MAHTWESPEPITFPSRKTTFPLFAKEPVWGMAGCSCST